MEERADGRRSDLEQPDGDSEDRSRQHERQRLLHRTGQRHRGGVRRDDRHSAQDERRKRSDRLPGQRPERDDGRDVDRGEGDRGPPPALDQLPHRGEQDESPSEQKERELDQADHRQEREVGEEEPARPGLHVAERK